MLRVAAGASALPALAVDDPQHQYLAAFTSAGHLLVIELKELPVLPKGKSNKIIQIPRKKLASREEFLKHHQCLQEQREYFSEQAICGVERALQRVIADLEHLSGKADADEVMARLLREFDVVRAVRLVRSPESPLKAPLTTDLLHVIRAALDGVSPPRVIARALDHAEARERLATAPLHLVAAEKAAPAGSNGQARLPPSLSDHRDGTSGDAVHRQY